MKTLDEILIEYFGSGFEEEWQKSCESYEKLLRLVEDVGKLTGVGDFVIHHMVKTLDEISDD